MKKILCLLLAVLMIVPIFAACNNEEKPPVSTDDGTSDSTPSDSDSDTGTTALTHKVPVDKLDFGAEEFHYVAGDWQGYPHYFFAEEESSDPMESALYNRRRTIEDALNVTMSYHLYDAAFSELHQAIEQDMSAGSSEIDMALLHCIMNIANFSSSGYLYPLQDLKYVDLTAPWWNQEQMDNLRLGSKYYFGVNDFMIPSPYVIFFNKDMVEDMADMEDPYTLVLDQKWTLDVFEEMARKATIDLDTDGSFTYAADSFGVAVDDDSDYCSFIIGCDQPITRKNDEGKLVVAMNTEKSADILARFAELDKENVFYPDRHVEPNQLTLDSGRLLFYLAPISSAEKFRDYEVEYGLLPYPKYDEQQENYKTLDWGGLMCVPSVVANPELTGAVLELLAYESKKEVIPTYYDIVLDGQLSRDPQTVKMLDILFETICYEPAMNYWGMSGSMFSLFFCISHSAIKGTNANFASLYAQHGDAAQKQIDNYYDLLEVVEGLYE